MKTSYSYDALSNTLTISAAFAKKASKVDSPEYNVILKLRHDFPNLTIVQEGKREGKKAISYAQMEDFIAMHRNADELKKTFERIKKLSRVQPMPYHFVKEWFESQFPYFGNSTVDADGYVIAANPAKAESAEETVEEPADNVIPISDSEDEMAS